LLPFFFFEEGRFGGILFFFKNQSDGDDPNFLSFPIVFPRFLLSSSSGTKRYETKRYV
tara:strand:- start:629 stop:802 length:174 start_codon:yes stop_codon:yes gene_type:complete